MNRVFRFSVALMLLGWPAGQSWADGLCPPSENASINAEFIGNTGAVVRALSSPQVEYVSGSSKKVCQLIGEEDVETGKPTSNQPNIKAGIDGTDLGFSFEHDGKLFFLFGDTDPSSNLKREDSEDAIASSTGKLQADGCIDLNFILDPKDHGYHPPKIPGIENGEFDVPAGGVSANGKMYVYFTTGHTDAKTMGRSVLGVSTDNGYSFKEVYGFSSDKFINVAPVKENGNIFLFGSGDYRKSDPYLSIAPEAGLGRKGAVRYFAGTDPKTSEPKWSTNEKDSAPLFHQSCVGELSVNHDQSLGKWVMLYNCGGDGITMRTADQPWGPWDKPQVIFDPVRDNGLCHFMHRKVDATHPACDTIDGPDVDSGGVYGPYMIPSLTETHGDTRTIYYTMSTWVPYGVVLMKTDIKLK